MVRAGHMEMQKRCAMEGGGGHQLHLLLSSEKDWTGVSWGEWKREVETEGLAVI